MNVDEIIEGIGKAAAAAAPAQEYCLLGVDWWPTCMTKIEWSAWGQVIAVTVALFVPYIHFLFKKRRARKIVRSSAENISFSCKKLKYFVQRLRDTNRDDSAEVLSDVISQFPYVREILPMQIEAFQIISPLNLMKLLTAYGVVKNRLEIIRELSNKNELKVHGHLHGHLNEQAMKLDREIKDLEYIYNWINEEL